MRKMGGKRSGQAASEKARANFEIELTRTGAFAAAYLCLIYKDIEERYPEAAFVPKWGDLLGEAEFQSANNLDGVERAFLIEEEMADIPLSSKRAARA